MGTLIVHREGQVLRLRLQNPAKRNALDLAMLAALDEQLALAERDGSIRLVLLSGTPGGGFSSGADIREWAPMDPDTFAGEWIAHGNAIFRRLEALRCPTVAVIEGACWGGGLELALCCDLRVATPAARLRFPELTIGAIPGWEGGPRLARLAGRGRVLEAVLTAREIDAGTGERWGVLNAVWPAEELPQRLAELSRQLCAVSPQAATLAKALIVQDGDAAAHAAAARRIKASTDSRLGIQAFFDKKTAVF
ncbi:enoyl-CoA hydratase/isomerase family protein [Pelomonas sp. KK5]|uniref:enoyl-CoA hydratase/isomerase family protein n=1 Tax=Pelomonas sp. KK5 TaxID=1855730 RepID=UPI00097C5C6C|nr:enoyl-CoA hydratase/isomerase family protein [Pelomonas sp. KK5]